MSVIRSYELNKFMSVIYTGGDVEIPKNEKYILTLKIRFLVCCSDQNANMIDFETGQLLTTLDGDSFILSLALNPEGKQLAMSCRSHNIIIWTLEKKRKYRVFRVCIFIYFRVTLQLFL